MMKFRKIVHTVIRLKPVQIRYQLRYRFRPLTRKMTGFRYPVSLPVEGNPLKLKPWISKPGSAEGNAFRFLNREMDMGTKIDWDEASFGKLWTYNLNYMDYLLQEKMDPSERIRYIKDFIRDFPGNRTGKEPYPTSLRTINWIKFMNRHRIRDREIDHSLYAQYRILLDNLEYHLMGNHLLENGFSLLFGGLYFRDLKMYSRARHILSKELCEQILSDGAHFELSPMYHQIILDRMLDAVNLLQNNPVFDELEILLMMISEKTSLMLGWLDEICFSDGSIPLFNDSTFGIAPSTSQLFDYARRLKIPGYKVNPGRSGYRAFNQDTYEIRLDVGEIGPPYQPGHAHADTMNFEIYLRGKPLIVDTGISTYEKNGRRLYERSTAAHNTVQLNGTDSSGVWGGFRVARRAGITRLLEGKDTVQASHNGYRQYGNTHQRSFRTGPDSILIMDRVHGRNHDSAVARFHFHPSIQPEIENNRIRFQGGTLSFHGAKKISLNEFRYAPEFNKLIPAISAEILFSGELRSSITFN